MTNTEKKYVAIFVASFIFGIGLAVAGLWGLYALLAHFMGACAAVCTIAASYIIGILAGLCTIKEANGKWVFNCWICNVIRRISFWEIDLITKCFEIIRKAGEAPQEVPAQTAEVVECERVQ